MERKQASGECDCGKVVYGAKTTCDDCRHQRKASRDEARDIWREDCEDEDDRA